ncbi:MAG: thioredoxin family protein [Pseudomonadota bacterium]
MDMRKRPDAISFICFIAVLLFNCVTSAHANELNQIPVKGKVTLVDISSEHCDTCEEMLPVIRGLKKDYSGKIEVIEVDFWKNPDIANRFETNTTPTILLFDKAGNEMFRGYGFIEKAVLEVQLKKAGVNR